MIVLELTEIRLYSLFRIDGNLVSFSRRSANWSSEQIIDQTNFLMAQSNITNGDLSHRIFIYTSPSSPDRTGFFIFLLLSALFFALVAYIVYNLINFTRHKRKIKRLRRNRRLAYPIDRFSFYSTNFDKLQHKDKTEREFQQFSSSIVFWRRFSTFPSTFFNKTEICSRFCPRSWIDDSTLDIRAKTVDFARSSLFPGACLPIVCSSLKKRENFLRISTEEKRFDELSL